MQIPFTKMSGAGNDFILVDNRRGLLGKKRAAYAVRWCRRKLSIGADGLILLEPSKKAHVRMRIFNPDGSEAEMCGNGVRCLAKFAVDLGIAPKAVRVETQAGVVEVILEGSRTKAMLPDPKDLRLDVTLKSNGTFEKLCSINTGVPHAVKFLKSFDGVDVEQEGRRIRTHAQFTPRGTNVNFVRLAAANKIEVRTYERGVEQETLACGTGSTASALVAASLYGMKSPVEVRTSGGEKLKIHFKKVGSRFKDVCLEGPVSTIFEGRVNL